jgi:alpha-beta hydrolase superfamily lysophospholipase
MTTPQQSILRTRDGRTLALQDWPANPALAPRGIVVLVHGLGEHSGRYAQVAQTLNQWGFAVRGYDQHGHGKSDGARGSLPTDTTLLEDLADVLAHTRSAGSASKAMPLIVLGHSMGGLVAARLVALGLAPIDGLVLSSPALDAGVSAIQKVLLAVIPKILPNLRVGNGLHPEFISHDAEVAAAYQNDPLVHDRISGRLGAFIASGGEHVLHAAPQWKVPTLLLYAGDDRLVNPQGSRRFAQTTPASVVTSHCFETLFHEIFNESEPAPVYAALQQWLNLNFDLNNSLICSV